MMGRVADLLDALTESIRGRASPIDQVPAGSSDFGHPQDTFAPKEYERYIATSNDVYSVAMFRARALAKLGKTYFDQPEGDGEQIPGGGKVGEVLRHVNPHWTWRRLIVMYELSMAIWGQNYWFVERGKTGTGDPRELWWAKPTLVRPIVDRSNYIDRFVYTPPGGGAAVTYEPSEVVWFRYPNIIDEFTGLAPLAAVRLAADVASASQRANMNLFEQGFVSPHVVGPPKDTDFTKDQASDFEKSLNDRFRGVDKAHRWSVFRYDFQTKEIGVSPKDAMFIEGMNLSFRQVCRGMGVPPALLADQEYATLANVDAYDKQLWTGTMEFEANFAADEISEQFIPMFSGGGGVKSMAFDFSKVASLQEDATEKDRREKARISDGRKTINEWRVENGYDEVPWGDVWWAPQKLVPVSSDEPALVETGDGGEGRSIIVRVDSPRDTLFRSDEAQLAEALREVFARMFDAAQRELRQGERDAESAANAPFNVNRFVVLTREKTRSLIGRIVRKAAQVAGSQAGIEVGSDIIESAEITQAAERLTQTMADTVTRTAWNDVRDQLAEGIARNESIDELTDRVRGTVGPDAAEWRARRIAQTETTRAFTDGQHEAWRKVGIKKKHWNTQGDNLVRETHRNVSPSTVGLEEDFQVGAGSGPGPGRIGVAAEDVNCRCFLSPVKERVAADGNGHRQIETLTTIRDKLAALEAS